jgi:hypothetical protein
MVLNLTSKPFLDFTLVIPTLGERLEELTQSLERLSSSNFRCTMIFVAPENHLNSIGEIVRLNCPDFDTKYIVENKGSSLPQAINQGLVKIQTEYWNWAGDDDRIILNEIAKVITKLSSNDRFVMGVGSCSYFASKSNREILNRTSKMASSVIFWGPNLIPQPSVVFRTKIARQLGGLDTKYKLAFDQDLISKSLKLGKIFVHNSVTSEYRWSNDTLTSTFRTQSLRESRQIRMDHASSRSQKAVIQFMYPLVVVLVRLSDLFFKIRFRK